MERSFINSPFGKLLGLFVFLGLTAIWVFWPRKLPPPVESNRVYHPEDGYSIIAPPDYTMNFETSEHTMTDDGGWLKVAPLHPGYFPPSIEAKLLTHPPDFVELTTKQHYTKGRFQGHDAWMGTTTLSKYFDYNIVFKDHDKWFELGVETPDYYDLPNSYWWPYAESFKYEPEKAKHVAAPTTAQESTLPATVPSDLLK